jgi:hypothetical protein
MCEVVLISLSSSFVFEFDCIVVFRRQQCHAQCPMGAAICPLESSYPLLSRKSADVGGPHNSIVLSITNEHKENDL